MTLLLPEDVQSGLLAAAREGAPEEVVGALAGDRGEDRSTVSRRYPATNAAASPETRYEIAPAEELQLLEQIDGDGFDVVGFYHSHPRGPPEPSAVDSRLAAWPGYSYVIASPPDEAVGSWRWTGEAFRRESIETV